MLDEASSVFILAVLRMISPPQNYSAFLESTWPPVHEVVTSAGTAKTACDAVLRHSKVALSSASSSMEMFTNGVSQLVWIWSAAFPFSGTGSCCTNSVAARIDVCSLVHDADRMRSLECHQWESNGSVKTQVGQDRIAMRFALIVSAEKDTGIDVARFNSPPHWIKGWLICVPFHMLCQASSFVLLQYV